MKPQPKRNVVIDVKGLSAEQLERKMNSLEATGYSRDRFMEAEGLMLFHYYEPQTTRDLEQVMELVSKIARRYLAWHRHRGLGNHASKAQVEYFIRSNHLRYADGSPLTSTDLLMVHTGVNLILTTGRPRHER